MKLPKWAITVTPFSKLLTLAVIIIFPIIGFVLGMQYQQTINQHKLQYITTEKIVKVPQEDTERNMMKRCGVIPNEVSINKGNFDAVSGPAWSPDCRHIVWSLWESGIGYEGSDPQVIKEIGNTPRKLSGREGVYIFTDSTKNTIKIYEPKKLDEMPAFKKWLDRNVVVFTADKTELRYDFRKNSITSVKKPQ